MEIPVEKICPICKKFKKKGKSWSAGPYGEAICKSCARSQERIGLADKQPPPTQYKTLPKECPICARDMEGVHRQFWVSGVEGLMCRHCACDVDRLREGEVRIDHNECCFIVKDRKAEYVFGTYDLPLWSEPEVMSVYEEQSRKMWEVVLANIGLAKSVVDHCISIEWIPRHEFDEVYSDAALPALMRSAVRFLNEKEVMFSTFARFVIRNDVIRWSKRRINANKLYEYDEEYSWEDVPEGEDEKDRDLAGQRLSELWPLLSKVDADVMWKKFVDGMTYEDIGYLYGTLPQAVYLRIRRIKTRCIEYNDTRK